MAKLAARGCTPSTRVPGTGYRACAYRVVALPGYPGTRVPVPWVRRFWGTSSSNFGTCHNFKVWATMQPEALGPERK
eukprot:1572326-Rhodomonas_salina.2